MSSILEQLVNGTYVNSANKREKEQPDFLTVRNPNAKTKREVASNNPNRNPDLSCPYCGKDTNNAGQPFTRLGLGGHVRTHKNDPGLDPAEVSKVAREIQRGNQTARKTPLKHHQVNENPDYEEIPQKRYGMVFSIVDNNTLHVEFDMDGNRFAGAIKRVSN